MKVPKILTFGLCAFAAAGVQGVPAYPGLVTTTQPDGSKATIRLYGDENFSWARSAEGYTLLRDKAGYFTVARQDASGVLVPTDIRLDGTPVAPRASRLGIVPMLPMTKSTAAANAKAPARVNKEDLQVDVSFPTTGKRKLLLILVNFAGTTPTYTQADFNNFMNQSGYKGIGSFRDFYLENSYGQLDIETTVTDWIQTPYEKASVAADPEDLIDYALRNLPADINLADFDNDGDGVLDGLAVIHQGAGQEATGITSDIWSHTGIFYGKNIGGLEIRSYTIQPETLGTNGPMSDIGVITHEFGHNLGAPDFYDTDYANSGGEYCGIGVWDLMSGGAWNGFGDRPSGDRPAHINMWQKIMFGWVEPVILTETAEITGMANSTENPVAYRFDTTSEGDYFILENRQQTGNFNAALPGHGLLIVHANEKLIASRVMPNTLNASYPQACYAVCAGAYSDPGEDPGTYGGLGTDNALFPVGNHSFNDATLPSTRAVDRRWAYKGLHNITESTDGKISFSFKADAVPAPPENLQAEAVAADVRLTWTAADAEDVTGYNVYRNEELIGTTASTEYIDRAPGLSGKIEYTVDALHSDGRLSPPVKVLIRVPQAKAQTLSGKLTDGGVRLDWTVDPDISRMLNPGTTSLDFRLREISGERVEYGMRFTAEDLRTYVGMKIRRLAFLPYQSLQEAAFTINIYEADADGSNPTLVSQRNIKEMGTGIWNSILLTKSVEIKPDKEYLTMIELQPKLKLAQLLSEPTDVTDGLGNVIRIDGGDWSSDTGATGNFYMYAILQDAASYEPAAVEYDGAEVDPDTDFCFPIGFRVYRDGMPIGESATRTFLDASAPVGEHTYQVTTLYKGNSETAPCEAITLNTSPGSVTAIDSESYKAPCYRIDGTRVADPVASKGIILRKGEKILK